MFHKSLRLPSFIPVCLDEEVAIMSSPERKKKRTGKGTTPRCQREETCVSTAEPNGAPSAHVADTIVAINDPVEWERQYLLDLLDTDASFDWDVEFLPRLKTDVVEPTRCTSTPQGRRIYETTVLGALVACTNRKVPNYVIETTLQLCPRQAACSQGQVGCTPLRAAVWNTANIEPSAITLLVRSYPQAVHIVDEDGLSPLDHCLYQLVLGQASVHPSAVQVLEALLQYAQPEPEPARSSLIHLLSLMNSSTSSTIFDCVRHLLSWDRSLATRTSQTTGCTPLHVAVRNNVSDVALVRELSRVLDVFAMRNFFGDTVLHVVCATGAPDNVLQYVLEQTLEATKINIHDERPLAHLPVPHPVVWSKNTSGYTPVDLEWIRYVECGDMRRPLDARGIPAAVGDLYVPLLERMCQKARGRTSFHRRLQWIVTAALEWPQGAGRRLHVSALLGPHGPTLPRSIVDLLSSSITYADDNNEECWQLQHSLHDVVAIRFPNSPACPHACEVWQDCTLPLITQVSCRGQDDQGRLPLHVALWWPAEASSTAHTEPQPARNVVAQAIASCGPQAVAQRDPVSKLYPFQAAACNPLVSLDTIYRLLRTHPAGLLPCR